MRTVSLADTVGTATPDDVGALYSAVKGLRRGIELGVHLHSRPEGAAEKVLAAYDAGCRRFDGALTGLGGCPFAGDDLVGNIATETVIARWPRAASQPELIRDRLAIACAMTGKIARDYTRTRPTKAQRTSHGLQHTQTRVRRPDRDDHAHAAGKAQRHLHRNDRGSPRRSRRGAIQPRARRDLTGEGKAFCSGMDLDELRAIAKRTPAEHLEDSRRMARLFRRSILFQSR